MSKGEELTAGDLALIADEAPAAAAPAEPAGKPVEAAPEAGKPAAAAPAAQPDPFGTDWREKLASGLPEDQRGRAAGYLKTRSSPFDLLRAGLSADQKISELTRDRIKLPTGKDDDPKDLAAYRKARGVPEAPDKYDVKVPKEYGELTKLDQDLKAEFLKKAHEKNFGQADVDFALETHFAIQKAVQAEQAKVVLQAQQAAVDELRVEFGKEYRGTVELINRMFEKEMGDLGMNADQRREFLSQRFGNGMALGEHPGFVKMMAKIARERADDGALIMGESEDGVDIDSKIDAIIKTRNTNIKEYERMQPELHRLIAAQNRMKARKG